MRISFSISSRTESGSVEGTVRSASEDELVGELLCESELLKVKPRFSFDEDVPTDSRLTHKMVQSKKHKRKAY